MKNYLKRLKDYLIKSILHNIGVVLVGFIFAWIGKSIDFLLSIAEFHAPWITTIGLLLLIIGFLIRVWATDYFYQKHLKVISLKPQQSLITSGPFSFSRNPLYLGGNVFIFFGTAFLLGSPAALFLTILNIGMLNFWMIPREEKQLKQQFGQQWINYSHHVRRWI